MATLAFEEDSSHDRSKRHLQKCDEHSECQEGSCCDRVFIFGKWCRKQQQEGERCYPTSVSIRSTLITWLTVSIKADLDGTTLTYDCRRQLLLTSSIRHGLLRINQPHNFPKTVAYNSKKVVGF